MKLFLKDANDVKLNSPWWNKKNYYYFVTKYKWKWNNNVDIVEFVWKNKQDSKLYIKNIMRYNYFNK